MNDTIAFQHPADRMNRLVIKQAEMIDQLNKALASDVEEIVRLKIQLQSLTWAAHLLLNLGDETPITSVDLLILQNEVEAAEALLGGAK